jgi:capsule polysaccharide export protein KpsE/RkpR
MAQEAVVLVAQALTLDHQVQETEALVNQMQSQAQQQHMLAAEAEVLGQETIQLQAEQAA